MQIKRFFIILLALLVATPAYSYITTSDAVTTNRSFPYVTRGQFGWDDRTNDGIVSIDTIIQILSDDIAGNIVSSLTEGTAGPLVIEPTTAAVIISIASADASTDGYITSAQYNKIEILSDDASFNRNATYIFTVPNLPLSCDSISSDNLAQFGALNIAGVYDMPTTIGSPGEVLSVDSAGTGAIWGTIDVGALGGASKALDNLASVAINTTLGDVLLDKINNNTLYVGPTSTYTTIDAALNAVAAGDTILVAEGTYTETITFDDDNITLKAIGSKENTTITQAAAPVVALGVRSGCVIDGFTISVTAADGATDYVLSGANDAVSDYNIVKNCDLSWTSANALTVHRCVQLTDGNWEFINSNFSVNSTYAADAANEGYVVNAVVSGHTYIFRDCEFTGAWANTGTQNSIILGVRTAYIYDCKFIGTSDGITTGSLQGIYHHSETAHAFNCYIKLTSSSSQGTTGFLTASSGVMNSYNTIIDVSNSDADAAWLQHNSGATHNSYSDNIISGDNITTGGTFNGYTQLKRMAVSPDTTSLVPTMYFHGAKDLRVFDGTNWHTITLNVANQ